MRLSYVSLCGFRGYCDPLRIEFGAGFTVIDGRNGVGKSSIFDAIEFVLLGTIGKYGGVSAAGETADDYIWWRGPGSSPTARFVEVGFEIEGEIVPLRRTMLQEPDQRSLERVTAAMLSEAHAPAEALRQLCASSIIRDEQIAALSLDLKEGERFKKLRDALGASDAEEWIRRASRIHDIAKRKKDLADRELQEAASAVNAVSIRLDETRKSIPDSEAVEVAAERLRAMTGEESIDAQRQQLAVRQASLDDLIRLENSWPDYQAAQKLVEATSVQVAHAEEQLTAARTSEEAIRAEIMAGGASIELRGTAQTYANLITAGMQIGLQDGHCPLCAASRSEEQFEKGLSLGRTKVEELDAKALERAELEHRHQHTLSAVNAADAELTRLKASAESAVSKVAEINELLLKCALGADVDIEELRRSRISLQQELTTARQDLAVLDSQRFAATIGNQASLLESAQSRRKGAEERLGIARRGEARAKAIFDAARRAAGEVLNQRLDLVMPLMSEFYKRLRPHPVWEEIDYKLRGDVQRSLLLQVGEELNPQFIYSSGQRRATGLAFLLSVNLSLSWNNWKSILLDDPVQHIDDFRSVHLAEVLAQVLRAGRQIICAAEDEALADLIARHLPTVEGREGKRITLGVATNGKLAVLKDEPVVAHTGRVFAREAPSQSAI
jgi:DNA repair exonuclease SbcCD ATPase subunit